MAAASRPNELTHHSEARRVRAVAVRQIFIDFAPFGQLLAHPQDKGKLSRVIEIRVLYKGYALNRADYGVCENWPLEASIPLDDLIDAQRDKRRERHNHVEVIARLHF